MTWLSATGGKHRNPWLSSCLQWRKVLYVGRNTLYLHAFMLMLTEMEASTVWRKHSRFEQRWQIWVPVRFWKNKDISFRYFFSWFVNYLYLSSFELYSFRVYRLHTFFRVSSMDNYPVQCMETHDGWMELGAVVPINILEDHPFVFLVWRDTVASVDEEVNALEDVDVSLVA